MTDLPPPDQVILTETGLGSSLAEYLRFAGPVFMASSSSAFGRAMGMVEWTTSDTKTGDLSLPRSRTGEREGLRERPRWLKEDFRGL
jgi:hypothetical protein